MFLTRMAIKTVGRPVSDEDDDADDDDDDEVSAVAAGKRQVKII